MKKKYKFFDFFEFSVIFLAFVASSLAIKPHSNVTIDVHYAIPSILLRLFVGVYIVMRMYDAGLALKKEVTVTFVSVRRQALQSGFIYALLVIIGLSFNAISEYFPTLQFRIAASPPENALLWAWFIFSIVVLACFEEILFRMYLPEKIITTLIGSTLYQQFPIYIKALTILSIEFAVLLLFAFGHNYLGPFAVLSAFVAGIVLRLSARNFKTIIPACIAHSINNIISFIYLFYMS